MSEQTGTASSFDGLELFYRFFPASPERALLVIAHGLGEHSGRYTNVIDRLAGLGFSIMAGDVRGHGRSQGARGHATAFDHYLSDLKVFLDLALKDRHGNGKTFLLGHSLGGLIATRFAMENQDLLDGLVISSPALGLGFPPPALKKIAGRIMSVIWPGLTLTNELDPEKISRDRTVIEAYINDPLVHDKISARFFTEFVSSMEKANGGAPGLVLPVLMQIAGADAFVNAEASREFFGRLGSGDKTLHVYDLLYHEVYNELPEDRARVLDDLAHWLESRL